MLYRVKQFMMSIYYSGKKIDLKYINSYLDNQEIKEFNKLTKVDKQHSIRVAKESVNILRTNNSISTDEIDEKQLIRVALLHDIGKNKYKLNPIEKATMVILDNITKSKIKKFSDKSNIIKSYYYHPEIGVEILKKLDKSYSIEFLNAIKFHHKEDHDINDMLQILKDADGRN